MAESRRRREHRLERVLGTPALFATAYGNVGSSIYYALGLTAVYALGLTPLVFVIAGVIFAATAATYAEGTVRYPEAGGSSSFARHAFNELVSFGAAWAQMLVYIVTIATSAFFVPHYLSVFWGPLRENPADIVGGAIVIVVLVALNIVGVQEATRLSVTLAVVDFATQVLLVILGFVLVFSPEVIRRQRALGRRADVVAARDRDPGGDARVHGRGDRVEPRRGSPRPVADRAGRVQVGRGRRLRHLLHAAARRALGDARADDRRRADDAARPSAGGGRLRERSRSSASSTTSASAASRSNALQIYVGILACDDPDHRHERRRDRRVADHVLDGHLPADARDVPPAASPVQDAVALARRLRGAWRRSSSSCPGTRRSSGRCTRSARRCRSPSPTPRSCGCA